MHPVLSPLTSLQHDSFQLRRMEDKLKKATTEEEKTRKAYLEAVSALDAVTPRYMDDMTQVSTQVDFSIDLVTLLRFMYSILNPVVLFIPFIIGVQQSSSF